MYRLKYHDFSLMIQKKLWPYLIGLLKKLFGKPNRMNDKEKLDVSKCYLIHLHVGLLTKKLFGMNRHYMKLIIESNDTHSRIFILTQLM